MPSRRMEKVFFGGGKILSVETLFGTTADGFNQNHIECSKLERGIA